MTRTRGRLFALLAALCALPSHAAPAPPALHDQVARVLVCDWVVTGAGTPRYWMGPLQGEVLTRRLRLSRHLLITDAFSSRRADLGTAVTDIETLTVKLAALGKQFAAEYVLSGLIEDCGDKLKIQPVVLLKGNPKLFAPTVMEVPVADALKPQVEVVVGRFVRQMGLKLNPDEFKAMQAYQPSAVPEALELVGTGWRAWQPDASALAVTKWREALRLDPRCSLAADALAQASLAQRRALLDEAKALCIKQVADRPDDPDAHYQLGLVFADAGNWRDAATCYQRAIGFKTTHLEARLGLGVAYMQQNQIAQALDQFKAINDFDHSNRKALYNAGLCYARQGEMKEALDLWALGSKQFPDDPIFRAAIEQINKAGTNPMLDGLQ
ncbi:MAG: tetratricopeptide repeat protein [Armatimonadetes bacterium]|nr:tetratricopeptide repeat protein [Armatimonadota bacterium]